MNTARLLVAEEPTVAVSEPLAPGLYVEALPAPRTSIRCYGFCKRGFVDAFCALLLILLAPLLALIAILVRLNSPGPALFIQKRVGRNGELFNMYKFRSMYTGSPRYARSPTTSLDPRITSLGRLLRRTSLDELPQLLNVMLGNMSLVGPRPEMPFIVQHYNEQQRQRLCVTPGITGLWQLSPCRGLPIHQNIQYDLYYVRNRTFKMDVAILVQTVFFTMRRGI
jgi:lipopolysaccharide/colanic/teichoic acid biosynthesis glycosyltransferase